MSSRPAVEAIDLVKKFGDNTAVDRGELRRPGGQRAQPARAQRRGEDHHGAHAHHPVGAHQRRRPGRRPRRPGGPDAVRRSVGPEPARRPRSTSCSPRRRTSPPDRAALRSARAYIRTAGDELLERFALTDAANRTVKTYSGGMRRRLDLAVSLIAAPPVLFLDEPTTGLDPRSRSELWRVLRGLVREGATLLLTTQYLEEADQLADEIVVIDKGRGDRIRHAHPSSRTRQDGRASWSLLSACRRSRPGRGAGPDVLRGGSRRAHGTPADRADRPRRHDPDRRHHRRGRYRGRRPRAQATQPRRRVPA